jgi:anaerobic ribonucleoside-triphosphate reductase activating protein
MTKYAGIQYFEVVNGEGIGHSLFLSGCSFHCEGCFNQKAWDFDYGRTFREVDMWQFVNRCREDSEAGYISRVSILGGEPLHENNIEATKELVYLLKRYVKGTIWLYTGCRYEDLLSLEDDTVDYILNTVDYLVDGRFVQSLYDPKLPFRGSSNQRIISLWESRIWEEFKLWKADV